MAHSVDPYRLGLWVDLELEAGQPGPLGCEGGPGVVQGTGYIYLL